MSSLDDGYVGTPVSSEDDILRIIDKYFPKKYDDEFTFRRPILARGDDCYIGNIDGLWLTPPACSSISITTDIFAEDVHFRRRYFTPYEIGYKAIAVNMSDMLAAGTYPLCFSLGLSVPKSITLEYLDEIFRGMSFWSDWSDPGSKVLLSGGDISISDKLSFCITIFGGTLTGLPRQRVRENFKIYVSGDLGFARAGLKLLEKYGREWDEKYDPLVEAFLSPYPQYAGQTLTKIIEEHYFADHPEFVFEKDKKGQDIKLCPNEIMQSHEVYDGLSDAYSISAMDVSDGLARDLPRLLGQYGALISLPPPNSLLEEWSKDENEENPKDAMIIGGEDYALLFAFPPEIEDEINEKIPDAYQIGIVTSKGDPILIDGKPIPKNGFDHFN